MFEPIRSLIGLCRSNGHIDKGAIRHAEENMQENERKLRDLMEAADTDETSALTEALQKVEDVQAELVVSNKTGAILEDAVAEAASTVEALNAELAAITTADEKSGKGKKGGAS